MLFVPPMLCCSNQQLQRLAAARFEVSHQIKHLSFGMQDAKGWAERPGKPRGVQLLVLRTSGELFFLVVGLTKDLLGITGYFF